MSQAELKEDTDIHYYDLRAFADQENARIFHGFFGRQGGVSPGVYGTLNCGLGSSDDPARVLENRRCVADQIGLPPEQLLTLYQSHSNECLVVEEPWPVREPPEADAMVTDRAGIGLAILTADCAPVLFYAEGEQLIIGAAHAGWKGAQGGVLENTIKQMEKLGAQRDGIKACIGPCIGKKSYEVDGGFYQDFVTQDPENEKFFRTAQKHEHFMFDLAGYCAWRLYQAGLTRVYIKDLDTYFNEEDFFSYRRAYHRGEKDYGRQISVIYIKP